MSAPLNEAGITATFAAIFARMDALELAKIGNDGFHFGVGARCDDLEARLAALEANAAPSIAPESAANAPEGSPFDGVTGEEVLDAIRIWRKVQACKVEGGTNGFVQWGTPRDGTWDAFRLLAWLKDGAE